MSDWYEPTLGIRYDPTLTSQQRQEMIKEYAREFPQNDTFVETGTADGATPLAVWPLFRKTYTIEISEGLYGQYSPVLREASESIEPILGDSMIILPQLLAGTLGKSIFWLDGHYCGGARGTKDTPVQDEIDMILGTGVPHVILVDDARLFGADPAYPTVEWVRDIATTQDIRYDFAYKDDVMRLTPSKGA